MKISTYHKLLGDHVTFVKGIDRGLANCVWDRIYITSLFTFDFDITVTTINFYKMLADSLDSVYVGGIMASLMPDKVIDETGITRDHILIGLFTDTSVVGDKNDYNVDTLPLDYDILDQIDYRYPAGDNYFGYTTRGCPNRCSFCAVPILEPEFTVTNNILHQIAEIDNRYGPKCNLLLLDNNVLNAANFEGIVDDLCEAGFGRGAKFINPGAFSIIMNRYHRGDEGAFLDRKLRSYLEGMKKRILKKEILEQYLELLISAEESEDYRQFILEHEHELSLIVDKYRSKTPRSRYIDFNQGIDARKITDDTMRQLARLSIQPLRIAFDDVHLEARYINAIELAHQYGVRSISNYLLFNYKDRPVELYRRMRVNIELNKRLGIQIFSFPMKYLPIERTDRKYVGMYWNNKYLQAISAILQVTKGVVAAGASFFDKAFGSNEEEFLEILSMPRDFIMFRYHFEGTGQAQEWKGLFSGLSEEQRRRLLEVVSHSVNDIRNLAWPEDLREIIPFYLIKYNKTRKQDKIQEFEQMGML